MKSHVKSNAHHAKQILVLNVGSSTVKYALFEKKICVFTKTITTTSPAQEVKRILAATNKDTLLAIGHRVVHGLDANKPELITKETKKRIAKASVLAPLHNPFELEAIELCESLQIPQIAVYDTSFFASLPLVAKTYALPTSLIKKYNLHKVGYHGISHEFLLNEMADLTGKNTSDLSIITCHLGSGCSVAAIEHGKAIDTSLGFSTTAGVMMRTRSGDIDPGLLCYLAQQEHMSIEQLRHLIEKESGFLGLSGSDDVIMLCDTHDFSVDVFAYQIAKYIGTYHSLLSHCDGIVFSAGIGEHSALVRKKVCDYLKGIDIEIDTTLNAKHATCISKTRGNLIGEHTTRIYVIPTHEELSIAKTTLDLVSKKRRNST